MTPDLLAWVEALHGRRSEAVAVVDTGLRVRLWNEAMRELTDLSGEHAEGVTLYDLFPRLRATPADAALISALRGEHVRMAQPFFAASTPATARETEWFVAPLLAEGQVQGCLLLARSRVRRDAVERELFEVEQRFRDMADSSPVLLWMSGTDSLCTFFNKSWLEFSGRTMEEELGVGWTQGVHPEDFQHCMNTYGRAFSARVPFEMEYRLRRKDGAYRWILDRGAPRYDTDGAFIGFIGSCADIDDRLRAEQATRALAGDLERANVQMEQLLYAASHDLHEPIRMVTNFLELLRRRSGPALDETALSYLEFAREGGTRMGSLVDSLLAFSRTRSGTPSFEAVDAGALAAEVVAELAGVVEENGAHIDLGPLPVVRGDRTLLRSLLHNLLANALKFRGDEPPRVSVSAQRQGNEWVFAVADNGIGFDAADAQRIFEMFRRLHPRAERPGNGIGLALAREIVQRHGGSIWARATPGQGATFSFTLPDRAT